MIQNNLKRALEKAMGSGYKLVSMNCTFQTRQGTVQISGDFTSKEEPPSALATKITDVIQNYIQLQQQQGEECQGATLRTISRKIKRVPCDAIRLVINEMVNDGVLCAEKIFPPKGGRPTTLYYLAGKSECQ